MYVYDLSPHKLPNFETPPIPRMLNSGFLLRFEFPSSLHDKFRDVNIPWFSVSRVCFMKFRVLVSRVLFVVICCSVWNILRLMLKEKKKLRNIGITKQSWSSLVLRHICTCCILRCLVFIVVSYLVCIVVVVLCALLSIVVCVLL
jgi:hypothetical protein